MPHEAPRSHDAPDVARYLAVGLTLALSTLGFLWLGTVVDGWLETEPVFTLIGAFVGAAAGFYNMIHHLVTEPRRRASKRGEGGGHEEEERSGREGR